MFGRNYSASPSSNNKKQLDILLIGKTGHGKSSTGNSILGRAEFETSSSSESVTIKVKQAWTEFNQYTIKVVDGPGVGDTRMSNAKARQKAVDDMAEAMAHCPKGFHALILVYKFGNRFTEEEQDAIGLLKSIFGPGIIQNYGVIVITCGEIFDMEYEEKMTIQEWVSQQKTMKCLFDECNSRYVLFRNKTKNETIKQEQRSELFRLVEQLKNREARYTNDLFMVFEQQRDRLKIETKLPQLREGILRETQLIICRLDRLEKCSTPTKIKECDYDKLHDRVAELRSDVEKMDKKTGLLDDMIETLRQTEFKIMRNKTEFLIKKQAQEEFETKLHDKEKKFEQENFAVAEEKIRMTRKSFQEKVKQQEALRQKDAEWQMKLRAMENSYKNEMEALKRNCETLMMKNIEEIREEKQRVKEMMIKTKECRVL